MSLLFGVLGVRFHFVHIGLDLQGHPSYMAKKVPPDTEFGRKECLGVTGVAPLVQGATWSQGLSVPV